MLSVTPKIMRPKLMSEKAAYPMIAIMKIFVARLVARILPLAKRASVMPTTAKVPSTACTTMPSNMLL